MQIISALEGFTASKAEPDSRLYSGYSSLKERIYNNYMITEEQEKALALLRERIKEHISGKRLLHSYGVEREIARLSSIYAPDEEYELRAAALLHDITKPLKLEEQLKLCDEYLIPYSSGDRLTPKIFHAQTACEVIRRKFPEFFTETVYNAVLYHTTGQADMTIGEKLLYLADYIEDTRTFDDCVRLREYFWQRYPSAKEGGKLEELLRDTLIISFDMTIRGLLEDGVPIHRDTVEARNFLLEEREFEKQ